VKILATKRPEDIDDETLILADVAAKARTQVGAFVAEVLAKHLSKAKAAALATTLSDGRWTHDFPITVEMAKGLGLPVTTDMPRTVYDLMDLYPQGGRGRPSVLYVPLRPSLPERGESTPAAPVNPPSGTK
jgi:ClpP class serine protease